MLILGEQFGLQHAAIAIDPPSPPTPLPLSGKKVRLGTPCSWPLEGSGVGARFFSERVYADLCE
jgi:hypothetical protein